MVSVHASEIFGWFYRKGQEKSFNMLLENQGAKHCQRIQSRMGKYIKKFSVWSFQHQAPIASPSRIGGSTSAHSQ